MKKNFLILILLLNCIICKSQIIYSDNFDQKINNFTSSTNLSTSIHNNNLQIIGYGNGGKWENLSYTFHTSGKNVIINASENTKLYIKAKTNNATDLRLDLQDQNGYVTNANPTIIYPNSEYTIFELDFTNKLKDGGYGGPCTSAPCQVDSKNLKSIILFLNPGKGNFNGVLDIEWISIGEPLEAIPELPDYEIRYNQLGYFTEKDKMINIVSKNNFTPKNYEILNSNESVILSGISATPNYWKDSHEYIANVDISSINIPGVYKFKTGEFEKKITISNLIYNEISKASLKYFYFNRASTSIDKNHGGLFARNQGHLDNHVIVHHSAASTWLPTGSIISSSKGWYDAGDYNKYIVNSGISTHTLLSAFEHYKNYYENLKLNIPNPIDSNLPDLLFEIKWNLDWMLTMQDADGSVYHKLSGLRFSGELLPEDYNLDRYVIGKSTSAALNFTAVLAMASRIFSEYLPNYSITLLNAAKSAYSWAKINPEIYFSNPTDVTTGEYGDTYVKDEFQWAAVELFITTSDFVYKNDINLSSIGNGVPSWQYTSPLALISMMHHDDFFSSYININDARNLLLSTANALKRYIENNLVPTTLGHTAYDYGWGSNGAAANQIIIMIRAFEITKDYSFLSASYKAMDYILGNNGTGYCYVTGFGAKQVLNPHHRISKADHINTPIPGMLAGGPNSGQQDVSDCFEYPNNYSASSYTDSWCSYASNEVAINWNAPLAYALNALQFYQNETSLNLVEIEKPNNSISIYPNPSKGVFQIKSFKKITSVIIYNSLGKIIKTSTSKNIDVSKLTEGLYYIKIKTTDHQIHIKKLLKK